MIFEFGPWRIIRMCSIGDREHVRTQLLSIGCFEGSSILNQAKAAFKVGTKLRMMTRFHFDANQHSTELQELYAIARTNQTHQIEEHRSMIESKFMKVFERLDFLIESKQEVTSADVQVLEEGIIEAWNRTGGRFLNGNFARLSRDELSKLYPDVHHDYKPYWENYANPL